MSVVTIGLKRKQNEIQTKTAAQLCNCCNGSGTQVKGTVEVDRIGLTELYDDCVMCSGLGRVETLYKKVSRKSSVEVIC